jgi:hypothetical protein
MKTADTQTKRNRDFSKLISKLSGDQILDRNTMMHIRGGDDNGGIIIILPPKP